MRGVAAVRVGREGEEEAAELERGARAALAAARDHVAEERAQKGPVGRHGVRDACRAVEQLKYLNTSKVPLWKGLVLEPPKQIGKGQCLLRSQCSPVE